MKKLVPEIPVIFCTAFTETSYLLKAIELGVAAFVRKPVDTNELLEIMVKAALPVLQRREIRDLSDELRASMRVQIGESPAQMVVVEQTARAARTSFNILLAGETGTGKSRLASIIHNLSPRRDASFFTVQMGALPLNLAESELFGHVRGAFTGADRNRAGLAEAADGGTLFLDDIDACPIELQVKLLRFVEAKTFIPLGSTVEKKVDVRVIAASNTNLEQEAQAGRFRQDLYYRLADTVITLPLLRETKDEIEPLARKFLQETCDELGIAPPSLTDDALKQLVNMPWPGNIRQLKSVIRRVILTAGETITEADITAVSATVFITANGPAGTDAPVSVLSLPPFPCRMDSLETWVLEEALRYCHGQRMKTAAMLGMNYYTFRRKLEKHGIAIDEE
ncbi:MAG: sigma-54 dependent transcriptional regulator [Deltaproteobacteria bacterium]